MVLENRRLAQSSFIVFVDMISFSVQLVHFHPFCLRCFIENVTTCENLLKKIDISRSISRRNPLKREIQGNAS